MSNYLGVGAKVQYLPTPEGKPQAALITDWDAANAKAALIVFPPNAHYGIAVTGVTEGVNPGNFRQLAPEAASASGATTAKK